MNNQNEDKSSRCYNCKSRMNVPGDCHIKCINPDTSMTGNQYGKENGWFFYPSLFDPVWMTKDCDNYKIEKL